MVGAPDIKNINNKKYCATIMEAQLRAFLEVHRVKAGEPFTHTTLSPSGKYFIGEDAQEDFLTLYCNAIKKGVRPTVTEKPGAYFPLRVDFDLKASLDTGLKRQYTTDIVRSIVEYYQQEIKKSIPDEEFKEDVLTCIVLEKKSPRVDEGKVKDGFHLHFPRFMCEAWFQDEYLRSKVTEKMIGDKIWEGTKFIEPVDKFIDTNMGKKQWLMYGSAKAEGAEPYMATKIFDHSLSETKVETVFEEEMAGRKSSSPYYLPRFLSIRGYEEYTSLKPEVSAKRVAFKSKKTRKAAVVKKRSVEEVLADLKLIKEAEFMSMLSEERADEYATWLEVGFVLFNVGQGCDEALQLWLDFSKRSSKFVEGECEDLWGKMKMGDYTIGSIKHMAQHDDPDRYREWKSTDLRSQQYKSLMEDKPNEWDVAQVVFCMYKDVFKCADAKKDIWYHFDQHRWHRVDDGVPIRLKLATDVANLYYELKAYETQRQVGADETERTKSEKKEKKCREIISALKTCGFQDKVIRMSKILFHDPRFVKKLNENKLIFACENGVIDLETGQFRDGRPDDCISFSCGINYSKFTEKDDEVLELHEFFHKVFPNVNRREYFLDAACATMEGGNVNKTFIIGTGDGHNAKSVTYALMELTFGDYCIKFPRELLILGRGNSSSGPRPELARVRGRRLAMVQEIAKTETLNIGILKELTGNDSFFARGMYEVDAVEIRPMFTLWMQCNEPPKVPGQDEATWNRIRILEYESKFVMTKDMDKWPVPNTEKEQFEMKRFKADTGFSNRLPDLAPVFLWMLFERYKDYKKRGLREPQEVSMATNVYRAMNDIFVQFIEDRIEKVIILPGTEDKKKPFLKLNDVHAEFTTWYSINHSSYAKEKITKITLLHEFNKRFGPAVKPAGSKSLQAQGWYGYRIAEDEAPTDEKQQQLQDILAKSAGPQRISKAK